MRIAYCCLHYGKEYLAWALRSIQDAVDQIHVLYTPQPSFGHNSPLQCPDSEDELFAEAHRFTTIPVAWHRGSWSSEGEHRSAIYKVADDVGARQVLVVDADEVWQPGAAEQAFVMANGIKNYAGACGVNMVHLWRSFAWVNKDHWMPIRVLNIGPLREVQGFMSGLYPVVHCGYAQSLTLMKYKWSIHGHKDELRQDWFYEKFMKPPGTVGDVHPTTNNIWTPVLRDFEIPNLADHPYRDLAVIE